MRLPAGKGVVVKAISCEGNGCNSFLPCGMAIAGPSSWHTTLNLDSKGGTSMISLNFLKGGLKRGFSN